MNRTAAILVTAALLLTTAATLNLHLHHHRTTPHLTTLPPAHTLPPSAALTTIALGGFRGILADLLWMRAGALQDEGRFFELVQLSDWIVKLQPRSPAIWGYHAWNMAYNIAALMPSPEEKWRWVRNGLHLLRDEGLVINPGSAKLHQELAWIYLHKLGTNYDPAADHYRREWAAEVAAGHAALDPDLQRQLEATYGPLDWHTPQAHAIYWAATGLPLARLPSDDLALRRIIYQALIQYLQQGQTQWQPAAIAAVQETIRHHPDIAALHTLLDRLQSPHP